MTFQIKSKGVPRYNVWAYNKITNKWDCWGEVHSPEDYPDMLEKINNGDFRHTSHTGNNNYTKIYYQPNEDVGNTPNRLGLT